MDRIMLRRIVAAAATVGAFVALVGSGIAVGDTVGAWAGWLLTLVVLGAVAVRVGGRVLDDKANAVAARENLRELAPQPAPRRDPVDEAGRNAVPFNGPPNGHR